LPSSDLGGDLDTSTIAELAASHCDFPLVTKPPQ
jgi:hypothetical protein